MRRRLFIIITLIIMCLNVEAKPNDKDKSIFSDFTELGISKKEFRKKFGRPTSKGMHLNEEKDKVEVLSYAEVLNNNRIVVVTKFTFENGKLIKQESEIAPSLIDRGTLDKLLSDISLIQHKVMFL